MAPKMPSWSIAAVTKDHSQAWRLSAGKWVNKPSILYSNVGPLGYRGHLLLLPHYFPLLAIDNSLSDNGKGSNEHPQISGKEFDALGQIGNENSHEQEDKKSPSPVDKNTSQISGLAVVLTAAGILSIFGAMIGFYHSFNSCLDKSNRNTISLDDKHKM
jgi:hypothetical protein